MVRAPRHRSRGGLAILGSLLIVALMSALAPNAVGAPGAYEPNDTILGAVGPLANHQSYLGGLEAENDKDFFSFYVTSPSAQVTLTLRNLGGGPSLSYVGVAILDASGAPLATMTNVEEGEARSLTATLEPQKYFVEVISSLDYGAEYNLETHGGDGAFGPYAAIVSRCAGARSTTTAARSGLTKAEAKLQRANARLHRSLYGTRAARKAARAVYRGAKTRASGKRRALETALSSQRLWCFIAQ